MPIVNSRHGSSSHHYRHARSWGEANALPQADSFAEPRSDPSNLSHWHSVRTVAVEHIDIPYVTAAGLLFLLVVGYLFRRQTRSILSRFSSRFSSGVSYINYISDIGVNGVTSYFVQVRLGSAHYTPIPEGNAGDYDAVPGSPVSPTSSTERGQYLHQHQVQYQHRSGIPTRAQTQTRADIDAAAAPAYSVRTNQRNGRLIPSLHINVPPSVTPATIGLAKPRYGENEIGASDRFTQSPTSMVSPSPELATSPVSGRSWSSWTTWSPISAFTSASSASTPAPSALQQQTKSETSNYTEKNANANARSYGVGNVASPRPSPWEASSRAGYFDTTTGRPCIPSHVHSEMLMGTSSPSATPPPQYTITIHASPRPPSSNVNAMAAHGTHTHGVNGVNANSMNSDVQVTPDIVLSPVPWMPRQEVPPSPPHYLAVPSRKSSRSRKPTTPVVQNANIEKPLPYAPYVPRQSTLPTVNSNRARPGTSASAAGLSTARINRNVEYSNSTSSMASPPSSPITPPRPLSRSGSVPPPQPVLPFDLEAVYPSSPPASESESSEGSASGSGSGSGSMSSWREKGLWASRRVLTRSDRSQTSPSPTPIPTPSTGGFTFYGSEKGEKSILRDISDTSDVSDNEKEKEMRDTSDSEYSSSPKEFFLALRRKGDQVLSGANLNNINVNMGGIGESAKPQVLKKKLFGRISALAARARQAIENELDSSDDESNDGRDEKPYHSQHQQQQHQQPARFHSRGLSNAFIIGDEDQD